MSRLTERRNILEKTAFKLSARAKAYFYGLILLGGGAFLIAAATGFAAIAWQGLLVSAVFFAGIAQASLIFSVIGTIADAYWVRPIKRFAEVIASFGVVSAVIFVILFFGARYFFQWYDPEQVIYTKAAWLNFEFFVIRQLVGLAIMALLTIFYLKNSLRPDLGLAKQLGFNFSLANWWGKNYEDHEAEAQRAYHANKQLAPWVALGFGLLTSLIAFDWMMSIDQEWFSTMFGVQYLASSMMGAGAVLIIASGILQRRFEMQEYQSVFRHNDVAKLTFAFSLLWTYMIFSQLLVIWYANLPEETPFLILRINSEQWSSMFWVIFFAVFIIPFAGLMSRTACRSVTFSRIIAIELLIGLWLEKYFIIAPSMQENELAAQFQQHSSLELLGEASAIPGFEPIPFLINVLIGLGLLGSFLLWVGKFMEKVPLMAIADNRLAKHQH